MNCNTKTDKLSFLYKLKTVYIFWFNTRGLGMDSLAKQKRNAIHNAINENMTEVIKINFHKIKASHYVNGQVQLPDTVNQNDRGDKVGALHTLGVKTRHLTFDELTNYNSALSQAIEEAETDTQWSPSIGDIDVTS
jgi:hypothetical protein